MTQHLVFKRIFAHLYSPDALASSSFDKAFAVSPDGRLAIRLGDSPDIVDSGVRQPFRSTPVLGVDAGQEATTPDGQYRVEIDSIDQDGAVEFWLIHTEQATGVFNRVKLSAGAGSRTLPRIGVAPGGAFFLVDDNGTVRLYDAAHLHNLGVFGVAHPSTENEIAAMAVSADDRFVAALNRWKDLILYYVPERRVVAVRHIDDGPGWYDPGYLLILGSGAAVLTAGCIAGPNAAVSINLFRSVPSSAGRKADP